MYVGYNCVYFLAALQSVDRELLDAAAVDGADGWSRFWHVTVPAIKPVVLIVVIMSTLGSFQDLSSDDHFMLESDQPVMLSSVSPSQQAANVPTGLPGGDPSLLVIPPTHCAGS